MLKLYYAHIELIENQQIFDHLLKMMNMQRRSKVLRCKNEKDKKRSLLAGALLKYGLEREGICYEEAEFAETSEGKPILVSRPDVFFSISHSGEYVACLIADKPCGVDIEGSQRRLFSGLTSRDDYSMDVHIAEVSERRLQSVVRRCFTEKEYAIWQQSDKNIRKELFLNIWTRKESYSKAIGKGLQINFSEIDTEIWKEESMECKNYFSKWLTEEYYISIYVEGGISEEILFEYVPKAGKL